MLTLTTVILAHNYTQKPTYPTQCYLLLYDPPKSQSHGLQPSWSLLSPQYSGCTQNYVPLRISCRTVDGTKRLEKEKSLTLH